MKWFMRSPRHAVCVCDGVSVFMCHPISSCEPFTNFSMDIMPLEATPTMYFKMPVIGNKNMADEITCEVEVTLVLLRSSSVNVQYTNHIEIHNL
jgi:hypothetical protein